MEREANLQNKRQLTRSATELLCLKEGVYSPVQDFKGLGTIDRINKNDDIAVFAEAWGQFMVIYDDAMIEESIEVIKQLNVLKTNDLPIKVYVFSNGQYPYTEDFEEVLDMITLCALPDAIYKAYQNVLPKKNKQDLGDLQDGQDKENKQDLGDLQDGQDDF